MPRIPFGIVKWKLMAQHLWPSKDTGHKPPTHIPCQQRNNNMFFTTDWRRSFPFLWPYGFVSLSPPRDTISVVPKMKTPNQNRCLVQTGFTKDLPEHRRCLGLLSSGSGPWSDVLTSVNTNTLDLCRRLFPFCHLHLRLQKSLARLIFWANEQSFLFYLNKYSHLNSSWWVISCHQRYNLTKSLLVKN